MVESCVVQQRLLDESDELTLRDRCLNLGLSKLEEKLEAGHLVVFLQLK